MNKSTKKNKPIIVRTTAEEKAYLEEMAALAGVSLSRFLATSALGAQAPSREALLRWDMALFQLRRVEPVLRGLRKDLKKRKDWAAHTSVEETMRELRAALLGLGAAWSGE